MIDAQNASERAEAAQPSLGLGKPAKPPQRVSRTKRGGKSGAKRKRARRTLQEIQTVAERVSQPIARKILALDLSLTHTGWTNGTESGALAPRPPFDRGIARLRWIRDQVVTLARGADVIVIEGYSFASRGRAIISLGELGGVVRCALADAGHVTVDIPPTCRALFATGKGNASKEAVLVAAVRQLGYAGHDHDEADALWLHAMACAAYGIGPGPANVAQRKALAAVEWPHNTLIHEALNG